MFDRRRPVVSQGVFETMLVLDGRPVELDAHLARLHASLSELFPGQTPPPLDVPRVRDPYGHARRGTSDDRRVGVLRVVVAPDKGGELSVDVEWRKAPPGEFFPHSGNKSPAGRVALASHLVPGGLGEHKWVDRSLLDEAQAGLSGDALPLIVDSDGAVLEASRANLFTVRDGALHTPPLDGRILPGITRGRVLEIADELNVDADETELSRADLHAADEVFLTGSVRGIEPAGELDGSPLPGGGPIAEQFETELWLAWARPKAASP